MNPITGTLRRRLSLRAAIVLLLSLSFAGSAWAFYPPDGTKPDGPGAYRNPDDGICVVGIKPDGSLRVDWSIKTSRDCVAYTTGLGGMTNSASCTIAGAVNTGCTGTGAPWACCSGLGTGTCANDGYKHTWSTSLCYDKTNQTGISRVDLDNTDAMCISKGGEVLGSGYCTAAGVPFACCTGAGTGTCGACLASGWQYLNRKADGSLPVAGAGVSDTPGPTNPGDGLGFCATSVNLTAVGADGTYTSSANCPSKHNSRLTADPVGGPYVEWPDCQSTAAGCQTQASYDLGLGWSFASSQCRYQYGVKGKIPSAVTKADGTTWTAGSTVDLTTAAFDTMGECLAAGFSWDNWLPVTGTTTKTNASGGDYAGMPANTTIVKLDALTNVEDSGGGDFYSGTGAVCQKCHADQSRGYQERDKPGYPETRHKLAGDAIGKPFQPNFVPGGSPWGLTGVQCAMCHSTAKPAQDDLIQVQPSGYSVNQNLACTGLRTPYSGCTAAGTGTCATITAGTPKSASGHNNTEYGTHLIDICYTCHGTPASPIGTNPASVIPVAGTDFANTDKGLPPIANQFLNSPHAKYTAGSSKADVGNADNYASRFEGWICRAPVTQFRSAPGLVGETQTTCQNGGFTWYTTTGFGNFCYYKNIDAGASCAAAGGTWTTTYDTSAYRWASAAGGPGGVCYGVGLGAIITTVYRNGVAERIHNLDSTINTACTSPADGSATSGAAGYWLRDGETSAGTPTTTDQGNCMTCHDVHWALADTNPKAEALRRECTTCHSNPGTSATVAPQINLATINHLSGAGTPIEDPANHPDAACESCHMPKSAAGNSPMHLWRISTDPSYVTLTGTQVPLDGSGQAWVDLDRACGQCHGGGTVQDAQHQPVPPALYRTRADLAIVAKGMHSASGVNYGVTFSTAIDSVNPLEVDVDATVDCGVNGSGIPLPCPAFAYDWNWGDSSLHGSGDPATHTYTAGGTYPITLTVTLASDGQQIGSPVTRSVTLTAANLAPTAAGSCLWNADTWTMTVIDTSVDPDDADLSHLQVVVDWGDLGAKTAVPRLARPQSVSKTYNRVGTFFVSAKALDIKGASSTYTCLAAYPAGVTPAYFSIGGTVKTSGAVAIPNALVVLKKGVVSVASKLTATDGTYTFPNLKPGTYSITVTKAGYGFGTAPQYPSLTVGGSKTADVTAVTTPSGLLSPKSESSVPRKPPRPDRP